MKPRFSLDDLQLFHKVVQQGGLRLTSEATGIPTATISRRIKNLENDLGCRLLERSAHHFSLTDMGRHYFNQCGPLLDDLHAIADELDNDQHNLAGSLKITAPVNLTQQWLGQCFFEFMQAHPKIRLELVLSGRYENLIEQQFDAAFRVGSLRDNSWIARHLWNTRMALCASPAYLQSSPPVTHPRDLLQHHLVVADYIENWALTHKITGETFSFTPQAHLRSSDILVALGAATAGLGITLIPNYYFYQQCQELPTIRPQVVTLLPDWRGPVRPVNLLYRDREVMSARLRTFIDFVLAWMESYARAHLEPEGVIDES